MSNQSLLVAKKFWEVIPTVMRTTVAEARRGDYKLSPIHFRILHVLSSRGCSLSELAQHQDVSLPSMSETIQTLVERGWVERDSSPEDRRVTQLKLSRKGQQILTNEHKRLVAWVASRLGNLESRELDQVDRGLNLLLSLFEHPRENTEAAKKETEKTS